MSDLIGRTIGGYQLVQLMTESEQTLLFKAFQPSMDRYVAVTLLKPHVAQDASFVQRFLQAAEIAAQMQHANILPIYDSGQDEDMVYRVSSFLEEGTVRENLIWFHDLDDASVLVGQITAGLALGEAELDIAVDAPGVNPRATNKTRKIRININQILPE